MTPDDVRRYFDQPEVVDHYLRATANVGLWRSEEAVFTRVFRPAQRLLELGTGTARIAIALSELGYRHILGVELSEQMLAEAQRIAGVLEAPVVLRGGDATRLEFENGLFEGAIFGFNGLMQIPGRAQRRQALREIRRVLVPGAHFVFTTHDREATTWEQFWREERERWDAGRQKPGLEEYGDRWEMTELGELFIHIPDQTEVREDLAATGWTLLETALRSEIALEPPEVQEFSDDCRFWVAQTGGAGTPGKLGAGS